MNIIEQIRAEIERRMVELSKDKYIDLHDTLCRTKELNRLLSFLSSLESQKPMVQEGFSKEFDEYFVPKNSEQKGRWGFADIFSLARHFFDLGCRRTAEKYDEIEYNRQRAEEHLATSGKTISVKPSDEVTINGHKVAYDKDKDAITMEEIPNDLEEAAEEWAKENYGINYMDFGFTQDAAFRAMYHFRAGAKWQAAHTPLPEDTVLFNKGVEEGKRLMMEEFEGNRLAACDSQIKEEYDRETDFVDSIIKKEHRQPTFSDAINYGMRLQKEQMMKDAEEGEIENASFGIVYLRKNLVNEGYSTGDKVRVIIVKED